MNVPMAVNGFGNNDDSSGGLRVEYSCSCERPYDSDALQALTAPMTLWRDIIVRFHSFESCKFKRN
jgi:hypothetical protein